MSAGEVVLTIGAAGCGKSSWLGERFRPWEILSLDDYRRACTDDIADQSATQAAVRIRAAIAEERMQRGLVVAVDAVNTVREHRMTLIHAAQRFGRPTVAVVFHTAIDVCLARQKARRSMTAPGQPNGRAVPEETVRRQYAAVAEVWDTMGRWVDCVVHVSPTGLSARRVGDVPDPAGGVRPEWLGDIPAVPGVDQLPWRSPYER